MLIVIPILVVLTYQFFRTNFEEYNRIAPLSIILVLCVGALLTRLEVNAIESLIYSEQLVENLTVYEGGVFIVKRKFPRHYLNLIVVVELVVGGIGAMLIWLLNTYSALNTLYIVMSSIYLISKVLEYCYRRQLASYIETRD